MRPVADSYNAAMSDFNLTDHFLIAMPAMQEGVFAGTLTYVCEHNENGALGIVDQRRCARSGTVRNVSEVGR